MSFKIRCLGQVGIQAFLPSLPPYSIPRQVPRLDWTAGHLPLRGCTHFLSLVFPWFETNTRALSPGLPCDLSRLTDPKWGKQGTMRLSLLPDRELETCMDGYKTCRFMPFSVWKISNNLYLFYLLQHQDDTSRLFFLFFFLSSFFSHFH